MARLPADDSHTLDDDRHLCQGPSPHWRFARRRNVRVATPTADKRNANDYFRQTSLTPERSRSASGAPQRVQQFTFDNVETMWLAQDPLTMPDRNAFTRTAEAVTEGCQAPLGFLDDRPRTRFARLSENHLASSALSGCVLKSVAEVSGGRPRSNAEVGPLM